MSNLETNGSPQLEVIRSYIQELEKRDVDRAGKALHKDYCRLTYPKSVGKPAQTKEEHLQFIGGIADLLTEDCEVSIHSVIEVPGKVVLHLTTRANTSIGVELNRELIWIAHLATDEDGSLKIKQLEEFTVSKASLNFTRIMVEARANQAAA